jgi:peptidoglycan hydrolase-like protein with peptidoglycan-binding domain
LVLAFALGAIASAAGIYAFDGMNRSLGPPPIMTATPPLLPSPMPAPPPAPVIVEATPVVPSPPVPAMERPDQYELNTSKIWEVQERLEFLGMQPGSPDGIPGYRTFNAIRRYEESRGQAQTGKLDRKELWANFGDGLRDQAAAAWA